MTNKVKTGGYRGMLRDRMKEPVNLALKRCKCKDKYIEYIYRRFVANKPVELRGIAVKQILGLKAAVTFDEIQLWAWKHGKTVTRAQLKALPSELRFFEFEDTIDWEDLKWKNPNAHRIFKIANSWAKWFKAYLFHIHNVWKIDKEILHWQDYQIEADFKKRFKIDDETIKFLIKYLKNGK